MKKQLTTCLTLIALLTLALLVSGAGAYDNYAGGCEGCHGAFTAAAPYVSNHDGVAWKNPATGTSYNLHDGHRSYMLGSATYSSSGTCNVCHLGSSRTPVYLNASNGVTGFPAIGCAGCHDGDGLREHHVSSGADSCYDCHDPGGPAPENVLPPYYFTPDTAHPNKPTDPCNANGSESRVALASGLDNDGNLLYDAADPACAVAAPVLGVSPATLTFSNQNVGTTSASQTVTISNTGNAALTINTISNSNATDFAVTAPATPFNIAAGGSQAFTLAFKPGSTGAKSATISIASNGGNGSVSASGTGTTPPVPVMGVSPASLAFGNQDVGTTSAAQTVTISNTGTGTLNVTSISSSNTEFKFSPATLSSIAPGGSALLSVTFAPTTTGAKTATISITSDGGNGSVSASGTGTIPNVTVPNVVGMTQAAASAAIKGASLTVGTVTTQSSTTVPAGQVISQNPAAGASVASGSAVNLVVSSGTGGTTQMGDVSLVKLTVPKQITARKGRTVEMDIIAEAMTTAREQDATVTLKAVPAAGVTVRIDHARQTEEIKARNSRPRKFDFEPKLTCTQKGTWPVTWTATITAAQNSNPANDTMTGTTQVVCR
jgi:beta-lactam-binding protein with PASTA domain